MNLQALLDSKPVWALGGALVSVVIAYFTFSREILKEVYQLKGMSTLLLQRLTGIDRLQERLYTLEEGRKKDTEDLRRAWTEIKTLKGGALNGSPEPSGHG